ncbi:hypothetical protein MTR67_048710 [Solanum verrucosum]|uniref:Uncharacterized protein n=1 Tax=Solanum verrucosum TaxID=315347 RepID=A0AAF0ZZW4_SOLVR|nr:hypothetical protein MTR67_048710 [Solanum verrucosum]
METYPCFNMVGNMEREEL